MADKTSEFLALLRLFYWTPPLATTGRPGGVTSSDWSWLHGAALPIAMRLLGDSFDRLYTRSAYPIVYEATPSLPGTIVPGPGGEPYRTRSQVVYRFSDNSLGSLKLIQVSNTGNCKFFILFIPASYSLTANHCVWIHYPPNWPAGYPSPAANRRASSDYPRFPAGSPTEAFGIHNVAVAMRYLLNLGLIPAALQSNLNAIIAFPVYKVTDINSLNAIDTPTELIAQLERALGDVSSLGRNNIQRVGISAYSRGAGAALRALRALRAQRVNLERIRAVALFDPFIDLEDDILAVRNLVSGQLGSLTGWLSIPSPHLRRFALYSQDPQINPPASRVIRSLCSSFRITLSPGSTFFLRSVAGSSNTPQGFIHRIDPIAMIRALVASSAILRDLPVARSVIVPPGGEPRLLGFDDYHLFSMQSFMTDAYYACREVFQ